MPKILVIDDHELHSGSLAASLPRGVHEVIPVRSKGEALSVAGSGRIDMAVIDLSARGLWGEDFLEKLSARLPASTPMIVHSGWLDEERICRYFALGVRRVLFKPTRIRDLVEAIREIEGGARVGS